MTKLLNILCSVLLILGFSAFAQVEGDIWAYCGANSVIDGNTIMAQIPNTELKVRLADISAPAGNAYSAKTLRSLVAHQRVSIYIKKTATGFIGKVYVRGLDVNREMVKRGAARYTPGSMPYEMDMEHAQDEAKRAQRGIWQKASPTYRW